ncbi:MAG: ABC transporter permease, partial [Acidimicrobiia bacterium]|nr:ABC transporter permease [Acidimicrobiia bacterium]
MTDSPETDSTRTAPRSADGVEDDRADRGRVTVVGEGDVPAARWLWLRWSWRDLRDRWVAVATIALVLAIGIGVFAGLGSTATWRRLSNDASFGTLGMHDLRVTLSPGTFVEQGRLTALVAQVDDGSIEAVSERLVVDSQMATTGPDGPILLAARLVGMELGADPGVDELWIQDGDAPPVGAAEAVLEGKFAEFYDLPTEGTVTLIGGHELDYVGHGVSPEDFFYEGPEGSLFGEGELAIAYLPLDTAQDVTGRTGQVNDVVLTLSDGADRAATEDRLAAAVAGSTISATVTTRDDATAVRVLYEDIDNDQRFWNALSALVLAAAALAAFNLVSRIVEAQRREIGIGMALGVARWRLAIRPMLVGVQVGVLGALAGVGVGLLIGQAMESLLRSV